MGERSPMAEWVVLASGRAPTVAGWLTHWHETIAVTRLRPQTYENDGSNG